VAGKGVDVQVTEVSVVGVRCAVIALKRADTPLRFLLFPMVHVGRPDYYADVATRLRRCDLIVAEGYDGPSSTGRAYVTAMRLTGRRAASPLVHQDIDYAAAGVPVVWPEGLDPDERRHTRMPFTGWLDMAVMVPVLSTTMLVGGRDWLLRRRFEVDDDTDVRASRCAWLDRKIVEERDDQLVQALAQLHETRSTEDITVGIVYGAAHMPAVVRAMSNRYGYRPRRGGEWLTAIEF
jgi:hypothetical protein